MCPQHCFLVCERLKFCFDKPPVAVGSVGETLEAGGRAFILWRNKHSGSLDNREESTTFIITSANGLTFKSSRIRAKNR